MYTLTYMTHHVHTETEVTILDINAPVLMKALRAMGARQTQKVRLVVDWYRPVGIKENEDPWYLRIRPYNGKRHEVTWKALSRSVGVARAHKEINFDIPQPEKLVVLFEELGLEHYAHQEKDRTSFILGDVSCDFDAYPNMPTYVEIEGAKESSIRAVMKKLNLTTHRTWNQGERKLIQQVYGLDWYHMRF